MKLLKARIQTLKHWTTLLDDDAATFDDEFDEFVVATELVDEMLPAGNRIGIQSTVSSYLPGSKTGFATLKSDWIKYRKIKFLFGKNGPI